MKILETAKYKKAQNDLGIGGAFQGGAAGINNAADQKAAQYAQKVIDLINQGVAQQQAFDQVMTEMGIGSRMQVFRGKIIEQIKNLYNSQQQPTFDKTYDQQYPTPSIPVNRQVPS